MRVPVHKIIFICIAFILLWSCKKDEQKTYLSDKPVAPVLTASSAAVILDSAKKGDNAQVFSWAAANYGYSAAVTYTLQLSLASDSFKSPVNIGMGTALTKAYTTNEFNSRMISLGVPAATEGAVQARVIAAIAPYGDTTLSNIFSFTVKPYKVIISYPSLWVPGDYQGWDPATAATMASVRSDGAYEGYVYYPAGGTLQFKLNSNPDWSHTSYGSAGNDVPIPGAAAPSNSGSLSKTGGNLTVPVEGYYKLNANTGTLKWSALKTSWSIIGDATPGGWTSDRDMKYDPVSRHWTITADLKGTTGTTNMFKFRANHDWTFSLGIDANGNMVYGGSNIAVPSSGNYTITLDLSIPGNYNFTIKKN